MVLRFLEYLSGEVPGGLPVLLAVLLGVNLTFLLLRKSELISPGRAKNRMIAVSAVVLMIYLTAWIVLQPPRPRIRIVALPTLDRHSEFHCSDASFRVPELCDHYFFNNLKSGYLHHRWEWMYETLLPDSVTVYPAWENLTRGLNAGIVIRSRMMDDGSVELSVEVAAEKRTFILKAASAEFNDLAAALNTWPEEYRITGHTFVPGSLPDNRLLEGKRLLLHRDDRAIKEKFDRSEDAAGKVIYAQSLLRQGIQVDIDRERARYTGVRNPCFDEVKRLLYPLIQAQQDPIQVAVILGRIALWEEQFEDADIFLKKALADDPLNSRIYVYLSSMLSTRFRELGFENRTELLEKAVELDPAYNDAVHALAREYYVTGTGTHTGPGTTNALRVMESFLKLQSTDPKILSLLATTYLKLDRLDEALGIYQDLQQRYPQDSNAYYNLGIVFFHKKEYPKALDYFLKAIAIDQNPDAYLYAGLAHRSMGDRDAALAYYRERVKRKTGDDDVYAKEAMAGIRLILEEIEKEKAGGESDED